jgi:hypothetical protein
VRYLLLITLCFLHTWANAQTLGGNRAFSFLQLPAHAHLSTMGGMVLSNPSNDIGLATYNPALLRPAFHNQLMVSYNFFYGGSHLSNAYFATYTSKLKTSFAGGITFLQYGSFTLSDANGNNLGTFVANDYVVYAQASRHYKNKWRYGVSAKMANSRIMNRASTALLIDAGYLYVDTVKQLYFGATAKNFGATIRKYNPANPAEPLPFDLQVGLTKKFLKAPIRISVLGHTLYAWDIRYDNPADAQNNILFGSDTNAKEKTYFTDKLFRHVNINTDIILSKNLELSFGYSHRRRKELALAERQSIVGFSYGLMLNLKKIKLNYARSHYHIRGPYNELSLSFNLKETFNLGKSASALSTW